MFDKNEPVFAARCETYDGAKLKKILEESIRSLHIEDWFSGKDVVIKPNLVRKMDPERGGTTHPAVLEATVEVLRAFGCRSVLIAESPGGIYNEAHLAQTYEGCGIARAAKACGAELNYDTSFGEMKAPDGKTSKVFTVIDPIRKADVIVNLSKMKAHGLLTQSCAAKNFFGVVPGVQKFEMHARFPESSAFASMLCDLDEALFENKKILNVCDGIVGMQGNGPTNGTPVRANVLLCGLNPFNIDLFCAKIMNMEGRPELLGEAIRRGWCPERADELRVIGQGPENFVLKDFVMPDTENPSSLKKLLTFKDGKYAKFFEPRPVIDIQKCKGCGECARSCPQKTIEMVVQKNGARKARIIPDRCIKCYCCQELCPFDSVKIKKNFLIRLAGKL